MISRSISYSRSTAAVTSPWHIYPHAYSSARERVFALVFGVLPSSREHVPLGLTSVRHDWRKLPALSRSTWHTYGVEIVKLPAAPSRQTSPAHRAVIVKITVYAKHCHWQYRRIVPNLRNTAFSRSMCPEEDVPTRRPVIPEAIRTLRRARLRPFLCARNAVTI
ncbi:hypothetical protein BV20DRAFT_683651 [Pilatotrama ljubarskyi]|nr:hypothetical protein BV20DRAFT_683651 [Pilatotrama ljubarskyi]